MGAAMPDRKLILVVEDEEALRMGLEENLKYAKPDATLEEMEQACRSAQIWSLIASLPQGLSTMVGERGHRLSGGEKQRLAIARLLLKSPSLVILDEATAHLDSENEDLVQIALKNALQGRTSIVIAHRLSTVMDADQILVIRDGAVAERGRHEELIDAGGIYSDLFSRQDLTAR
jgi:ATP-binding cassette subfamily B protein